MPARKAHAYAASFGDDLASGLISSHTIQGDTVLDPFMGSGTGVIEAYLLNRNAIGIDVDPVACMIVRTIGAKYRIDEIRCACEYAEAYLNIVEKQLSATSDLEMDSLTPGSKFFVDELMFSVPTNKEIQYWFAPVQIVLLTMLTKMAKDAPNSTYASIVRLALSSAIVRKWPNTMSLARDIDHSRPHKTIRKDLTVPQQLLIFRKVLKSVARTVEGFSSRGAHSNAALTVLEGDAGTLLSDIQSDSVDYVLTSPPYFDAIDYPRAHKYSQWWLWPERIPTARNTYIGLKPGGGKQGTRYENECAIIVPRLGDLAWLKKTSAPKYFALCRYLYDLNEVIKGLARVVKQGKTLTFVLANNKIAGQELPVCDVVKDLLTLNLFRHTKIEERCIAVGRRRYPYGIAGFKGLLESEYLINTESPGGCSFRQQADLRSGATTCPASSV
jgi:DNA modification methylase